MEDVDFVWDFNYLENKNLEYVDEETYNDKIDPLLNVKADDWLLFFINRPGQKDASSDKRAQNEKIYN